MPTFWRDGAYDIHRHSLYNRPFQIWELWAKNELSDAFPTLLPSFKRLASIWPSQSSVERGNGVVKHAVGSTLRNRCSEQTRWEHVLLADAYRGSMKPRSKISAYKHGQSHLECVPPEDDESASQHSSEDDPAKDEDPSHDPDEVEHIDIDSSSSSSRSSDSDSDSSESD